jgi:hypothetical protein
LLLGDAYSAGVAEGCRLRDARERVRSDYRQKQNLAEGDIQAGQAENDERYRRQPMREPLKGFEAQYQRFGSRNHENRKDRRELAIELNEEPAVVLRDTSPALQLTPQDDQLMSERGILNLKPDLRLEW